MKRYSKVSAWLFQIFHSGSWITLSWNQKYSTIRATHPLLNDFSIFLSDTVSIWTVKRLCSYRMRWEPQYSGDVYKPQQVRLLATVRTLPEGYQYQSEHSNQRYHACYRSNAECSALTAVCFRKIKTGDSSIIHAVRLLVYISSWTASAVSGTEKWTGVLLSLKDIQSRSRGTDHSCRLSNWWILVPCTSISFSYCLQIWQAAKLAERNFWCSLLIVSRRYAMSPMQWWPGQGKVTESDFIHWVCRVPHLWNGYVKCDILECNIKTSACGPVAEHQTLTTVTDLQKIKHINCDDFF